MGYTYDNRKHIQPDVHSVRPDVFVGGQAVSNAAMSVMLGLTPDAAGGDSDALRSAVMGRLPHYVERAQAQIPQAESEADRLSSAVVSGSPDAVKAEMGRRLGADFSGIRFHTDDGAALKTDAMGARAYTSGADVYFGSGGFDPGVAAHELVHTVQQGVVEGSAPTVSAPLGGIQMVKGEDTEKLAQKQTARNRKYNRQLSSMGPEAVERILSGKGGFFERRKFNRIMKALNGEEAARTQDGQANGELSPENMDMLYDAGGLSRQYLIDRVSGNLARRVEKNHKAMKDIPGHKGQDYGQYMRDLQFQSLRTGGGGEVREYATLAQKLAQPALDPVIRSLNAPAPVEESNIDAFRSSAKAQADQLYPQLPGMMAGGTDALRELNGAAMEKLRETMPDLFNAQHEDMAKGFVGETFALRAFSPALIKARPLAGNRYAQRVSNSMLSKAKDMMADTGGSAETQAFRDAVIPGFRPQQAAAAAPAPAPAPAPAQQAAAPKKKWWQFWK